MVKMGNVGGDRACVMVYLDEHAESGSGATFIVINAGKMVKKPPGRGPGRLADDVVQMA